jgi:hypothetical protein
MMQPSEVERYLKNKGWVLAWLRFQFFVAAASETRGEYSKSMRAAKELWSLNRERAAAMAATAAYDTYNKGRARLKKYKALRPAIELDPFAYWPPEIRYAWSWEDAVRFNPWLREYE